MQIKLYPRVHLTLISLHKEGYRANGGLGFTISHPPMTCAFKVATQPIVEDQRSAPLSPEENAELVALLKKAQAIRGFTENLSVQIQGDFGTHIGLGSGTGIKLACLEALFKLNNVTPRREELITLSGRGGTSGIGVHTYFEGGLIFDLGHRNEQEFLPSHAVQPSASALTLNKATMPNWDFGLCIPNGLTPKTRDEEVGFFKKTCPIRKEESYEALYHVLYGTFASILESDLNTFCESLKNIQKCAWKAAERAEYGDSITTIEQRLYESGAKAVALSSLGPSLIFVGNDKVISSAILNLPDCTILPVKAINTGREIVHA